MSADIQFNMGEFNAALLQYWVATKKDLAYVCNRAALNAAIKAQQQTLVAQEPLIRALPEKPWWPKFVAKTIINRRKGKTVKVGKERFRVFGKRERAKGESRYYTRETARNVSRALIEARLKKVRFIASGWIPAIKILNREKLKARLRAQGIDPQDISRPSRYRPRRPHGNATPAREGANVVAIIINKAAAAIPVSSKALDRAFMLAAADMRQYVRDSFLGTARSRGAKAL